MRSVFIRPIAFGWLSLAALACLAGCPGQPAQPGQENQQAATRQRRAGDKTKGKSPAVPTDSSILPVARPSRPYTQVHPNVERAWYAVEAQYFVLGDKLRTADELLASSNPDDVARGKQLKQETSQKISDEIFEVNDSVVKLFEEAIAAESDNPLNKAALAIYLKPRRKFGSTNTYDQIIRAMELMDEAIKLWPDEASFYFLKAQMTVTPQLVYTFSRSTPGEEDVIADKLDSVKTLLAKAERYDPKNAQINYYRAQLIARFAPDPCPPEIAKQILGEIRAGNTKENSMFIFPPPLEPYARFSSDPRITVASSTAVFYDHWQHYGWSDVYGLDKMQVLLVPHLRLGRDNAAISDLMYMYFRMGQTKPFERSYFSWQQFFLEGLRDTGSLPEAEKAKLASLLLTLQDKYAIACNQLLDSGFFVDAKEFNGLGLKKVELNAVRNTKIKDLIQPVHASFLKEANLALGLTIPISNDPKRWTD